VTPMLADERPIGAVYITFDRQRAVDADERRFVETIGRQAAQPFDRVRLLESERRSRVLAERSTERTRRLQRVTERLVAAASPAEVGDVTVREGVVAVAGDAALVYVVGSDGALELLSAAGYRDGALAGTGRVEAGASVPAADVVATGELVVLESREAIAERYPSITAPAEAAADGALICAPLVVEKRVLGALEITCREPRHFDEAERLVVLTLARQSGQALERARLHEAETAAAERVRSLQEVTAALSQAATAGAVVDTCLERAAAAVGARAGVVATLGAGGDVLEIAGARGYEDGVWSATRLEEDSPLAEAARTGESVWALTATEAARFRDVESSRAAGDFAWAAIPLTRPGGTLGTLLLGFAEPTRLLNEDRAWLIALAGQCSQALDRSRLYEDERATRRRSQRLQALTAALSSALTAEDVASAFLEQSVAALEADGSALVLVDEAGEELRPLARRGFDAESPYVGEQLPVDARHPVAEAFRRRRTIAFASRAELASAYRELAERPAADGIEAIAIRPLAVSGRMLGAAVFAWHSERRLSADEHALIGTMTSQCAQALDRARRYESERTIAEILQRSVLPERLPDVEGLELAARYVPGTSGIDVGGDWYDVIELERGRIGLVVGDVVGKGVQAAATMGQLRNALRAFAFEQLKPSSALTRLNRLADSLVEVPFATLAFLTVDPVSRICRYTLAGHPPPVVRDAAGRARFLEGGRSVPLGVGLDFAYEQDVVELPPGAMLLLYTDGLVERRNRPLEAGLEQLRSVVESGPSEPAALVDHVLARMLDEEERNDDVAVLAAGLTAIPIEDMRLVLPSEPEALSTVRDRLRAWLSRAGATEDEARDIVLAVWEACANAVEHAQEPTLGDFACEASHASGRVRVAVRDSGRWRPEVPRDHRGFGLHLMRTLMESVEVTPGARGTVVSMERRLGHATRAAAGEGRG
jgi:serine phosphatase RsbU (regulator of sigma subunit)/anti-sigma regulatory factor (Ser/Thr protein kinase)